ncbi:hypothetical protein [Variovorax sp. OV700]|uniref:hypothetical protein n=1 Tax=Variovorax sp. OV700 TaxID=1882826 RepID=UPI0011141E7B|nr:hypothetical protein [Variovorax sp. OV700]
MPLTIGGLGLWISYEIRKTQDRRDREALVAQYEKVVWDEIAALSDLQEELAKGSKNLTKNLRVLKDTERQSEGLGAATRLRRELFLDRDETHHNITSPLNSVRHHARYCLKVLIVPGPPGSKKAENFCENKLQDWGACAYAVVLGLYVAAKDPTASEHSMSFTTAEPTDWMMNRCPKAEPMYRF